jgi:molybdenum cofactor synthesis domain-containing protein
MRSRNLAAQIMMMKAAILTVSTSVAAGHTEDRSGQALATAVRDAGAEVIDARAVTDDRTQIAQALRRQIEQGADLIFTTGGTGLTPDDVTPEATLDVIDRHAPGFAEAMRAESLRHTPLGILTRGVSGIAGSTLIVNFPGNPKAIDQLFPVIAPTLQHAVATLTRTGGRPTAGH